MDTEALCGLILTILYVVAIIGIQMYTDHIFNVNKKD
jgi:hypothetical protein